MREKSLGKARLSCLFGKSCWAFLAFPIRTRQISMQPIGLRHSPFLWEECENRRRSKVQSAKCCTPFLCGVSLQAVLDGTFPFCSFFLFLEFNSWISVDGGTRAGTCCYQENYCALDHQRDRSDTEKILELRRWNSGRRDEREFSLSEIL